jgi:hypothetical protein
VPAIGKERAGITWLPQIYLKMKKKEKYSQNDHIR